MPLFGKREQSPVPPKSSFGILKESLFGSRPTFKPEQKQAAPELKKLFGKEGYKSQVQLREFARKAPYEPFPGTSKRLSTKERVGLIQELERRGQKIGQVHGLSESIVRERIFPQMKKEKYQLGISGKSKEAKELGKRIQQYEKWIKGH